MSLAANLRRTGKRLFDALTATDLDGYEPQRPQLPKSKPASSLTGYELLGAVELGYLSVKELDPKQLAKYEAALATSYRAGHDGLDALRRPGA